MSLLERRKNETKVTDYKVRAIGAYEEALQYLDAAEKMDSKRCELHLISPTITMGVFACELFSKSIAYACSQRSEIRGHKLKTDIYKMFSEETRNNLKNSVYDKQHFEEYVSDIEELFEVWRYNFEYEKKTSHYSFVLEYARALKTECERILLEKELLPINA